VNAKALQRRSRLHDEAHGLVSCEMVVDGQALSLVLYHETQMQAHVATTATAPAKDQIVLDADEQFEDMGANVVLRGTDDAITPRRGVGDLWPGFFVARHDAKYSGQCRRF
jgi:hypothetical protein